MKRNYDESQLTTAKLDNIIGLFDKLLNLSEPTDNSGNDADDELEPDSKQLVIFNQIEHQIFEYDSEEEWKKLNENFNKLNYFKSIITKVNKYNQKYFNKAFNLFMDKIDETNQYYLKAICFNVDSYTNNHGFNIYDLDTIKDMIITISTSLQDSLNVSDLHIKLEHVLRAYSNLVLLGSDLRENTKKFKF